MTYVLIGMSLFFIAIGFILTENNAKYILAGYNTMSEEDRENVDLKSYVVFFRKFHIFLGLSFFITVSALSHFINNEIGGMFFIVYPFIAYIYFISASRKFSKGKAAKGNTVAIVILILTLFLSIGLLIYNFKESEIKITNNSLVITGSYGETLSFDEIIDIKLIDRLPNTIFKTNGFALGNTRKGSFRTESREVVKLIINADNSPYIFISKADGKKIYYSAKKEENEVIFKEIETKLNR